MIFAHGVFADIANVFELTGMPDFMRVDDVVGAYEKETGAKLHALDFYATYAAIQWGIVFLRTGQRQAHFTGTSLPDNPDDLLHHRPSMEKLIAGKFWD
jgi:aminoglycoside phosphotransferase (APT) family kinase protein